MSYLVFPVEACVSYWKGKPHRLVLDHPWDADDPFVKAKPDLFRADPEHVQTSVEQTTANPGQKRRTAPRKKKA